MTRWPPTILNAASTADGGIEVTWEVDSFFADAEAAKKVRVDLDGVPFDELEGDETSVKIPPDTLAALGTPATLCTAPPNFRPRSLCGRRPTLFRCGSSFWRAAGP